MLLFIAGAEKKADSKSCVRPPTSNSGAAASLMSSTPPDLGKDLPPVVAPHSAIGSNISSSGIGSSLAATSQHYNSPLLPPSASSGFDLVKKEPSDRLYSPDLAGAASAYHLGGGGVMGVHAAPNHHHLATPPSLSGPHTHHHLHDLGSGGSSIQSGGMLGVGSKQTDGYNSGAHSPLHHLVPPSHHHHPAHHSHHHHHHAPGGLLDHHSAAAAAAFFRSEADALRSETDSHQRLC